MLSGIEGKRSKTQHQQQQAQATQNIFSTKPLQTRKKRKFGAPPLSSTYIKGDPLAGEKAILEATYGTSKTKGLTWEDYGKRQYLRRTSGGQGSIITNRPGAKTRAGKLPISTKMKDSINVGVKEIRSNRNIPTQIKTSMKPISRPKAKQPEAVKKFLKKMNM